MALLRGSRQIRRTLLLLGLVLSGGCNPDRAAPSTPNTPQPAEAIAPADTAVVQAYSVMGQTIYVPVYSHIYHQDGSREFNLTATLSIRNTDPERPITVTGVRYYDSSGQLVRRYVERPLQLSPLSSKPFVVEERDKAGGVGANFSVEWQAEAVVSPPVVEAVMISTAGTQGISFVSRGQAVRERRPSGTGGSR